MNSSWEPCSLCVYDPCPPSPLSDMPLRHVVVTGSKRKSWNWNPVLWPQIYCSVHCVSVLTAVFGFSKEASVEEDLWSLSLPLPARCRLWGSPLPSRRLASFSLQQQWRVMWLRRWTKWVKPPPCSLVCQNKLLKRRDLVCVPLCHCTELPCSKA